MLGTVTLPASSLPAEPEYAGRSQLSCRAWQLRRLRSQIEPQTPRSRRLHRHRAARYPPCHLCALLQNNERCEEERASSLPQLTRKAASLSFGSSQESVYPTWVFQNSCAQTVSTRSC